VDSSPPPAVSLPTKPRKELTHGRS
jgi:hypothetical protein